MFYSEGIGLLNKIFFFYRLSLAEQRKRVIEAKRKTRRRKIH
jgi:hypothetical protein